MPLSMLAASPFFSVILGFRGTINSSLFAPLGTKARAMAVTQRAGPLLVPHNFLLLVLSL